MFNTGSSPVLSLILTKNKQNEMKIIKYIKKLIKKQKLLKKYKKGNKQFSDLNWLLKNWKHSREDENYFKHQFLCELRCYNKIKKL